MKHAVLAIALVATPLMAHAQAVSGPYIGAAGGANLLRDVEVHSFELAGRPLSEGNYAFHPGDVGLGSLGYGFGNGLRLEIEGSYRDNGVSRSPNSQTATSATGHEEKYGAMANALYDFHLPWFQPYIGVGLGYQWTHLSEDITGPLAEASRGGTDGRFAYQGMLGVSMPVMAGLSMTGEYRFLGLAGDHVVSGHRQDSGQAPFCLQTVSCFPGVPVSTVPVSITTRGDDNQSFLIGLRYAFAP